LGTGKESPFDRDDIKPDPIKETNVTQNDNEITQNDTQNSQDNTDTNGSNEQTQTSDLILPSEYTFESEMTEDASYKDHIKAYDENNELLWEFVSKEITVGQYDNSTFIGERENGLYYVGDGVLFCIDKYTGEVLWKSEEDKNLGASCSYVFDENDNLYICGYESPALAVISKEGKTLKYFEQFTNEESRDYFWANGLYFDPNGDLIKTFENSCIALIVDDNKGEAYPEEFDENADWSECTEEWEMTSWQDDDNNFYYASDSKEKYEISITDSYWMTIKYTDENGNVREFSYMQVIFRNGILYEGMNEYYYGKWVGECKYDKENEFAFGMTDPDNLEVIWFRYDEEGNFADSVKINFLNAELSQYYRDLGY